MVVERVDSDLWLTIIPTVLDDDIRDELLEHTDMVKSRAYGCSFTSKTNIPISPMN